MSTEISNSQCFILLLTLLSSRAWHAYKILLFEYKFNKMGWR